MKTSLLKTAALVTLLAAPSYIVSAQDAPKESAPSAEAAADKPPKPAMDPEKQKIAAAKKQAMEDPEVKAAMELAKKAQAEANKLMYDKIKASDPSLAEWADKEEAKMKPREPKEAKQPKKSAKPEEPAANPATPPAN